jgi:hypothetical protein
MIDMETSVVSDLKSRSKAQPDGYSREKACEQHGASEIDPVMGSGTTAIVAEISERSWIGIDISWGADCFWAYSPDGSEGLPQRSNNWFPINAKICDFASPPHTF